jgi:ankyrin repeat protein
MLAIRQNGQNEMLQPDEVKLLQNAKENVIAVKNIDISKYDPKDHTTFIEYAMNPQKFELLSIYLQCHHADKALSRLIDHEKYQKIYIDYLFFQTDPGAFKQALAVLKKCSQANNVIRFLHQDISTMKKMPLIFYALHKKHYLILEQILESENIDELLKRTMKDADDVFKTPLKYAKNDKEACRIILQKLSAGNPYAQAIINNDYQSLKRLLEEVKAPPDEQIQQQLQIAGACSLTKGKLWDIDYLLFKAGMHVYPSQPDCKVSYLFYYNITYLYEILSSDFSKTQRPLQITLIEYCLKAIEQLNDPSARKIHLQESHYDKNLLELAFATKDPKIIDLLIKAGATLPKAPERPEYKEQNILIQSIKENNLIYFKSKLTEINGPPLKAESKAQLTQTAEYCIEQYDEKNNHNEKNKNIKLFLSLLLKKNHTIFSGEEGEKTLANVVVEAGKLSLLALLKEHGIHLSKHRSFPPEKKENDNPIDFFYREYLLNGNIEAFKILFEDTPEKHGIELNQASSQGLTLAELAIIHNQLDIFVFLVNHSKYKLNNDAVFDIIQPNKIKKLSEKYTGGEYVELRAKLKIALKKYPNDYKEPAISPSIASPTLDSLTLKKLVKTIVQGQLDENTLKRLARMEDFKHKVAKYLQRLKMTNLKEFKALYKLNKNTQSLQTFFAIQRKSFKPTTNRGALKIFLNLYIEDLSELEQKNIENTEETDELPSISDSIQLLIDQEKESKENSQVSQDPSLFYPAFNPEYQPETELFEAKTPVEGSLVERIQGKNVPSPLGSHILPSAPLAPQIYYPPMPPSTPRTPPVFASPQQPMQSFSQAPALLMMPSIYKLTEAPSPLIPEQVSSQTSASSMQHYSQASDSLSSPSAQELSQAAASSLQPLSQAPITLVPPSAQEFSQAPASSLQALSQAPITLVPPSAQEFSQAPASPLQALSQAPITLVPPSAQELSQAPASSLQQPSQAPATLAPPSVQGSSQASASLIPSAQMPVQESPSILASSSSSALAISSFSIASCAYIPNEEPQLTSEKSLSLTKSSSVSPPSDIPAPRLNSSTKPKKLQSQSPLSITIAPTFFGNRKNKKPILKKDGPSTKQQLRMA